MLVTTKMEPPVPQLTPKQERARLNFRRRMKRKLMKKPHWKVVRTGDDWPAIQAHNATDPFIVFSDQTVVGQRGAVRWADLVCAWMNEQMRLVNAPEKPGNCDAMILKRLHDSEAELTKLNLENQALHSRFMKLKMAAQRAGDTLHELRAAAVKA